MREQENQIAALEATMEDVEESSDDGQRLKDLLERAQKKLDDLFKDLGDELSTEMAIIEERNRKHLALNEVRTQYIKRFEQLIDSAQDLLKRSGAKNFQGVFSELILSARSKKRELQDERNG